MAAKRLTKDQWREAEALAIQDVAYGEISSRVGIAVVTLGLGAVRRGRKRGDRT